MSFFSCQFGGNILQFDRKIVVVSGCHWQMIGPNANQLKSSHCQTYPGWPSLSSSCPTSSFSIARYPTQYTSQLSGLKILLSGNFIKHRKDDQWILRLINFEMFSRVQRDWRVVKKITIGIGVTWYTKTGLNEMNSIVASWWIYNIITSGSSYSP